MPRRPAWAPEDIDIERPAPYACMTSTLVAVTTLPRTGIWPSGCSTCGPTCPTSCGRTERSCAVHEIVSELDPAARTVYADNDLVAVSHSRSILAGLPNATVLHADLREPGAVPGDRALLKLLDLSKPVAVLMFAVLHFVPDGDDPVGIMAAYRHATVPGSYLAIYEPVPPGGDVRRYSAYAAVGRRA